MRIQEAIVVEGRYDKAAVAAVADTLILETAGFALALLAALPLVEAVFDTLGGLL